MNGMPQPHERFTPASGEEMRTSPDAPPISPEERTRNQRQYERNMAQVVLAGKIFESGDPDVDLELWTREAPDGSSLAQVFAEAWPAWREKHTKAVDGTALEAFLKESGLQEQANQYRDRLDKAA